LIKAYEILKAAQQRKQNILYEYESKLLLSAYGIPVAKEAIVRDWGEAREAASHMGYPVVLKICSSGITHKTENKLIEMDLRGEFDLKQAFQKLKEQVKSLNGDFLVQEMVRGVRELAIGMTQDSQFGSCVMFGLGGIFTEVLRDISFRVAPIEMRDAFEMMEEIKGHEILNAIRGMDPVDKKVLGESLITLSKIGLEHTAIKAIDVNPMIVQGSQPVAVDALVVLKEMEHSLR
jgi:acyl-CoA synthetase (NDP forming)